MFKTDRLFIIALILLSFGCGKLRRLPEGETFLRKNQIKIQEKPLDYDIPEEELVSMIRQKPNRKILWFRFNHSIYLMVNKKKLAQDETKSSAKCEQKNEKRIKKKKAARECKSWRMFWAYTVGEPTVILDSAKMIKGAEQMEIFLNKKGYFNSKVQAEVIYNKSKNKCRVEYQITPGESYRIRKIEYNFTDVEMAKSLSYIKETSTLDSTMRFDVDLLDVERERIANYYNNKGYYDFTKDYIVYDADSTLGKRIVDIIMKLEQPKIASTIFPDSLVNIPHKKYFIGDIFIHTHYDPASLEELKIDTLKFDGLKILYNGDLDFSPTLISCTQGFQSGELYQRSKIDNTYKRYSQLGVLRATSIQLTPRPDTDSNRVYILDTHLLLTPAKKQALSFDPRVTHRDGNMGIYANFMYRHKNLFQGAESLEIRVIAGLEASQSLVNGYQGSGITTENITRSFRLNTFEVGPEITYRVPRLWPLSCDKIKKSSEPGASIGGALNFQTRPDYQRTLSQLKFSWAWIENPDKGRRVNVDWVEFSVIKIQKSEGFENFIQLQNNEYLANSYRDHLIFASGISVTTNTQKNKFQRTYFYWKIGASSAGSSLRLLMSQSNAKKDSLGSFEIAGIRFAQYVRGENDLRFYYNVNEKNAFVFRSYTGIGLTGANLSALPFEKSFFSGGANGIRAWQARTLGPGSSRDSLFVRSFNNIGEFKIEGNFEYRFKMTQMLNWALFLDVGNIWLLKKDINKPGADFAAERWMGELAVGTGIGLRLDFDFFLVRTDLGLQLKDPAKIEGERWLWQPKDEYLSFLQRFQPNTTRVPFRSSLVFNLGIGFPF